MSRDNAGAGGIVVDTPTDLFASGSGGGGLTSSPINLAAPSSLGVRSGRRTSKSVSGARPPLSTSASSHRTLGGYANPYAPEAGPSTVGPSAASPILGPTHPTRVRNGLKRRISTPNLIKGRSLVPEEEEVGESDHGLGATTPNGSLQASSVTNKAVETRARSTSTSIVVPQTLATEAESPTFPDPTIVTLPPQSIALPTPPWNGMYVTPPSPPSTAGPREYESDLPERDLPTSLLSSAYDMGESLFNRAMSWAQPKRQRRSRRRSHASDDDSEKGLNGSEDEEEFDEKHEDESLRTNRGWALFGPGSRTPDSPSYFALPPTPPDERDCDNLGYPASLPTPAISTQSLSHGRRQRRASRAAALKEAQADGWWVKVYRTVSVSGSGKTAEVLRELGWTVALLAGLFVVSFLLVLYAVSSMPM